MLYTSTDRWYFTADRSRVVRESDPAAAFLLVAVGGEIPMADAIRYGIVVEQSTVEQSTAPESAPEAKAVGPDTTENKARTMGAPTAPTETKKRKR